MKKLGFGCMRLPLKAGEENSVDMAQFVPMVDWYMGHGFCYFDTAHVYLAGNSELALREALVKRYPRDSFVLTDKLSGSCYSKKEDIRPLFFKQLEMCGVEYFDYYLFHALSAEVYKKVSACSAFEVVRQLKQEGRIRHIGISFHDRPEVLERILTEHPEIEVVQIQLNYVDADSPTIQSGRVYEVCRRFGKPVLVMEPVKGGALADLPAKGKAALEALHGGSPASYAIRYAASYDGVFMVLSGMSDLRQMQDNTAFMEDFKPLTEAEQEAIEVVRESIQAENAIACTACRYCVAGCPRNIRIPDLFASLNAVRRYNDWPSYFYYDTVVQNSGKASDCIGCRQCERICPQKLKITELLKDVAAMFEKPDGNGV